VPLLFVRSITGIILILVLICVIWRPYKINVAIPATVGALLAIAFGLIRPATLLTIFADTWDASATLISLFLLSEALDSNGFFSWAALHLARVARGSGWLLYVLMLVLTLATTALLANDGAILILTPIFARLLVKIYAREKEKERQWLPFVFAAGFLADAASALFIPSNLTNIIIADATSLNFTTFARWMVLPTLFAALVVGACFGLRFRAVLNNRYDPTHLSAPLDELKDRHFTFWACWGALVVLIVGYIIGGQLHLPISYIAGPVAIVMVLWMQFRGIRPAQKILFAAPWSILFYALGMFVVITAAYDADILAFLTDPLRSAVASSVGTGVGDESIRGAVFAGGSLALLSAGANNLPATLIGVLVLHGVQTPSLLAIYAMTLGVDIGPKLTPYGSLATLLWLGILARNGIHISWRQYLRENWWVTILALLASFGGLLLARWLL
jgi:arsenical pump membrane protein